MSVPKMTRRAPPQALARAPAPKGDSQGAEARQALWASVSERDWQRDVIEAATVYGWKVFHAWSSIHSPSGFPDLVLVHARGVYHPFGGVLYAELKTERGKLTPAQEEWIAVLKSAGQTVYLWRPSDVETMHEVLRQEGT